MSDKVINIKDLSYSYPDGTVALRNISFNVEENECIGIIGPNGAGKSTLLLHLNGILNNNGSVEILGMKINDENIFTIRKNVGLVFQDPDNQLFMPSVFDDVAFGPINLDYPKEKINSVVKEALKDVGMQDFAKRTSHHLSYGEKKKISIATVLSMDPKILVLDEPTSNLDPKSRRELITLLRNFNLTKIIVSHDLKMIEELCQRTIIIDKGTVIADNNTKIILSDKNLLEKHALEIY